MYFFIQAHSHKWDSKEERQIQTQNSDSPTTTIALHGRLGGLVHAGQFARIADGLRRTLSIPRPFDQIETILNPMFLC